MDLTLRPANEQDQLYSVPQSSQIRAQAGFLGWLRGYFEPDDITFTSNWSGFGNRPQVEECHNELETVLDAMRHDKQYEGFLQSADALCSYRASHPTLLPTNGFYDGACYRLDTPQHAYIFLINVNCRVSCMCYQRDSLDRRIAAAKQGIRFIDPNYNEKFRLADGDSVRIVNGRKKDDRMCRYIDPYHLEVGETLYHICEFAERMERAGNRVIPLRRSLPRSCMSVLESSGELIKITLGEAGYEKRSVPGVSNMREVADNINLVGGITKAQEAAMVCGSMFGWEVPGADPKNYDEKGHAIRPQHRDRDEAR